MEYKFKDIQCLNSENPRKYPMPKDSELRKIKPGCLVKLVIDGENKLSSRFSEIILNDDDRVIVKVISCRNGQIRGMLDYSMEKGVVGSLIKFSYDNILFVYDSISLKKLDSFNMVQYATISQRALEHKEINWAFRTTPLSSEDSGWQLFYGDENMDYIHDSSNSKRISIREVLKSEPLLEYVFVDKLENAEYNSKLNKFVAI